ncbi:uncharacterized protein LOC122806683 isoform X3 [Protopterus annectens]|uniref:uncharacterized protein LOC122806683 isoform X3 n=1 Tax=Protopterus annectens TaxID=7888 RepID=UPI001CFBC55F|nr:uncharacterized protein LOC122806683 isoform X3 [Protopterus annectens]
MPFTGSKKTAKRRHRVKKPQEGSCVDSKQQTRNAEYDPDKISIPSGGRAKISHMINIQNGGEVDVLTEERGVTLLSVYL